MNILLNGTPSASGARDIEGLIEQLGLPPRTILVEHNGLALRRREWTERQLAEGDRVEILRVVAGG